MALQDIATDLSARLGMTVDLGGVEVFKNAAPPRVVMVPAEDTYGAPDARAQGVNPRALSTCKAGIDVHVWGKPVSPSAGFTETEVLRAAVVTALLASVQHNFHLLGGAWDKGQTLTALGRVYVLQIAIDTPIVETTLPTQTITGEPQDVAFQPSPPHA